MRRILLTSSQVSVLLYIAVALFLSGYVIQQRTLKELRAAVRPRQPRPPPKIYLPDHFKEPEQISLTPSPPEKQPDIRYDVSDDSKPIIEVVQTQPGSKADGSDVSPSQLAMLGEIMAHTQKQSWGVEHPDPESKNRLPVSRAERRRLIKEEIQRLASSDEKVLYQRRLW